MFVLLNDDGYVESYAIVGNLVGGIEVSDPEDIEHFEEHYESYGFSEGKIHFDDVWEKELNKARETENIRKRRETECFPVINRGQLWYDTLSTAQLAELKTWYQSWLDGTNTLAIPEKPAWLN